MSELQTKQFAALAMSCWYNSYLKSHLANWMDPINELMKVFECVIITVVYCVNERTFTLLFVNKNQLKEVFLFFFA